MGGEERPAQSSSCAGCLLLTTRAPFLFSSPPQTLVLERRGTQGEFLSWSDLGHLFVFLLFLNDCLHGPLFCFWVL